MQKIIVTGAAGFIGSNLCLELERRGAEVVAIDDLSSGSILNLKGFKGKFITEDLTENPWYREELENVDIIYHMAAISDTRRIDQKNIMKTNNDVFNDLLEDCEDNKIRLVYASSAAVYGNLQKTPWSETDPTNPLNVYGMSKMFMENQAKKSKANTTGLRYFNVYGPREIHKRDYASMITQLVLKMNRGNLIKLFKSGEQVRDQVYIKDAVNATILAGESRYKGILNVGSGKTTSFNKIYNTLKKELNSKSNLVYINNPYSFYQNHTEADISLAKQKTKYVPKWSFLDAIKDYINWLKEEKQI